MTFWPADLASQIADVTGWIAFVGTGLTALYARARGNNTDKAVQELRQTFARRELLPGTAKRYQELYSELAALFRQPGDTQAVAVKVGEFRGMINTLDTYLDKPEKVMLKATKDRLLLIAKEPAQRSHLEALLGEAATLSVELENIVKRITWNSQQ